MAIDTSTLPPVQPVTVNRTNPDGTPTTQQLQWEEVTRNFYKNSITNLSVASDANSASISIETTARISGDNSLASAVIAAEARATGGSAAAQMRIVAEASPAGYSASYGFYLVASGNAYPVGMTARVSSGGAGSIEFLAQEFYFTDPSIAGGAPGNLLTYNGTLGAFVFGVPILARTIDIAGRAVTHARYNNSTSASFVSLAITDLTVGSDLVIIVIAASTVGYRSSSGFAIPTGPYVQISVDSVLQFQEYAPLMLDTRCTGGTGIVSGGTLTSMSPINDTYWQPGPGIVVGKFTTTSTSHSISGQWASGGGMPNADWHLIILESKR
jgi:hypothetical protein